MGEMMAIAALGVVCLLLLWLERSVSAKARRLAAMRKKLKTEVFRLQRMVDDDAEVIAELERQVKEISLTPNPEKPHNPIIKAPTAAFIRREVEKRNIREMEKREA